MGVLCYNGKHDSRLTAYGGVVLQRLKHDSRLTAYGDVVLQRLEGLNVTGHVSLKVRMKVKKKQYNSSYSELGLPVNNPALC